MKKINTYIIEKLHLDKNIKVSHHLFDSGDKVLRVWLFNNGEHETDICLGGAHRGEENIFIFDKFENDKLLFKKGLTYSSTDEQNVIINKNDFYQFQWTSHQKNNVLEYGCYSIYLNKYDAIEFINKVWKKCTDTIDIKKLDKWFDFGENFPNLKFNKDTDSNENVETILKDLNK